MSKPLVVMVPIEMNARSWGPFVWNHQRTYFPDGSDWTGYWSFGVRGFGQVAVMPPAWLLNAFVRWGWLELRALDHAAVAELRGVNRSLCDAHPCWKDRDHKAEEAAMTERGSALYKCQSCGRNAVNVEEFDSGTDRCQVRVENQRIIAGVCTVQDDPVIQRALNAPRATRDMSEDGKMELAKWIEEKAKR